MHFNLKILTLYRLVNKGFAMKVHSNGFAGVLVAIIAHSRDCAFYFGFALWACGL